MKPMPTTERGRRSRAAIIAAAAGLMHKRGLAAPSMDEVLAAADSGKSQLYHYFDSRRDLEVEVLHRQFERVMAAQPSLHDLACDDLRRWRDEVLAVHRDSGLSTCPLGAFVGQVDADPLLRSTLAELFGRWQDAIARLVERATRAGNVAPGTDPGTAALGLLAALEGGTMLAHLRNEPDPLAQVLNYALERLTSHS